MLPSQVSREVLGYSKTRVLSELKMVASDGSLFFEKSSIGGRRNETLAESSIYCEF